MRRVDAHGRPLPRTLQGRTIVILVTRLNGPVFALNPDLVERADCTPDTVITLVDGTKYVVGESLPEFVTLIRQFRASVIAEAQRLSVGAGPDGDPADDDTDGANVVQLHRRER
jgi:flagellar protein FlbD